MKPSLFISLFLLPVLVMAGCTSDTAAEEPVEEVSVLAEASTPSSPPASSAPEEDVLSESHPQSGASQETSKASTGASSDESGQTGQIAQPEYREYSVDVDSVDVTVTNLGNTEAGFGYAHRIEYRDGETWIPLPLVYDDVPATATILQPGESGGIRCPLHQEQYDYIPGQYRVVLPDADNLTAEFTLVAVANRLSISMAQSSYPVSAEEIRVTLTNNSTGELGYGRYYQIQYLDSSVWTNIPLAFEVEDIAAILQPGQSAEEAFPLYPEQHRYQAGKYRITLTDAGNISAEFELTGSDALSTVMTRSRYPVATTSVQVTWTNSGYREASFGLGYRIEFWNGGVWDPVPMEYMVDDSLAILRPGESQVMTYQLIHDPLADWQFVPGYYRIFLNSGGNSAEFELY